MPMADDGGARGGGRVGDAEAETVGPRPPASASYECYVLLHNVSKRHNVGNLARNCVAFGVSEVVLTGSAHYNVFGSQGSDCFVRFRHLPTLEDAVSYLRHERGCDIIGVEIVDGADRVHERPFRGNTAFMLGNEGAGLSEKQISLCDRFVYIPQYAEGTASLNVTTAAAITLHHFGVWAGFAEAARSGYKFNVGERPLRTHPRGVAPGDGCSADDVRAARQQRRAEMDADPGCEIELFSD